MATKPTFDRDPNVPSDENETNLRLISKRASERSKPSTETTNVPPDEDSERSTKKRELYECRGRQSLLTPNIPKANYSILERSTGIAGLTKAILGPKEAKVSQSGVASLLRRQGAALSPSELGPQLEEGENLNTEALGTGRTPPGGTSAPVGQAQVGLSPAFVKENIDVLRTMIKELDNRGQEKVTPHKLFNEE
ncbi:hypothetical protein Tco_0481299 [Tanacetum coccineum]